MYSLLTIVGQNKIGQVIKWFLKVEHHVLVKYIHDLKSSFRNFNDVFNDVRCKPKKKAILAQFFEHLDKI